MQKCEKRKKNRQRCVVGGVISLVALANEEKKSLKHHIPVALSSSGCHSHISRNIRMKKSGRKSIENEKNLMANFVVVFLMPPPLPPPSTVELGFSIFLSGVSSRFGNVALFRRQWKLPPNFISSLFCVSFISFVRRGLHCAAYTRSRRWQQPFK